MLNPMTEQVATKTATEGYIENRQLICYLEWIVAENSKNQKYRIAKKRKWTPDVHTGFIGLISLK